MLIKYSDYLSVDDGFNPFAFLHPQKEEALLGKFFDDDVIIILNGMPIEVVPRWKLVRTPGSDGKYHAVYIQINYHNGEYYIGKVNRTKWKELDKYVGSGVKFVNKYAKHSNEFIKYYLYVCQTKKETEELERKLVNDELLNDPFCLNIVKGGGGISKAPVNQYRKENQSKYMKEHPERYQAMLEAARNMDEKQIAQRNEKTRKTMSSQKYKDMTRNRIKNWKERDPEGYKLAREKNKISINSHPESKKRGAEKRKQYWLDHPEEAKIYQEKRLRALRNPETRKKQSESIKAYLKAHPEALATRVQKTAETNSVGVKMIDVNTKKVIKRFKSLREASDWLIEVGIAKGKNPASSISTACSKKKIPGHGTRKTAFGFEWQYETD